MKNLKTKLSKIALFALVICSFTACEDEELNSKDLLVFMRNWSDTPLKAELTYAEDGSPLINGIDEMKFLVYLTREATVDVQATIELDESLLASYNETNGTDYAIFPKEALSFDGNITIPAGQLQTPDSVKISFDVTKLKPGNYLLPLTISTISSDDKGIRASVTAGTYYQKFSMTIDNINNTNKSVSGEKVARSAWQITCTDDYYAATYPITNLLDGDITTSWRGKASTYGSITVDMGLVQPLKGLSFYFKESSINYGPTTFNVSASEDGEKWTSYGAAGTYTYTSSLLNVEYGINFFVPISCRYFKLDITGIRTASSGARLTELNALQ